MRKLARGRQKFYITELTPVSPLMGEDYLFLRTAVFSNIDYTGHHSLIFDFGLQPNFGTPRHVDSNDVREMFQGG